VTNINETTKALVTNINETNKTLVTNIDFVGTYIKTIFKTSLVIFFKQSFLCHHSICDALAYSDSPSSVCLCACVLYCELVKSTSPISTTLARIVSLVNGFQSCSKNLIPCRNLVAFANRMDNKSFVFQFCQKPQDIEHRYFASGIAWWTCTNIVQIIAVWSKLVLPQGNVLSLVCI
jgi:hypothetical protein